MARTCRFQFHLETFRAAFPALLLIACASGTARAGTKAEHLYLLAGTPTRDGASGFPVRLYTVSNGRLSLVRQVAKGLFSVTNDLSGHLYLLSLGLRALSVIHENSPTEVDVVPAPPRHGPDQGFDFYWMTWGGIAGPGVPPGIVYAGGNSPTTWRVTRIFAGAVAGRPRVTEGSWSLYRNFRYAGPGGEPPQSRFPEKTPGLTPGGTINHGQILMPYTIGEPGHGELGPAPPLLPAKVGAPAGYPRRQPGASVVADTTRFFAIIAPLPSAGLRWPKTVYVLNKSTNRWSLIKVPFVGLWPRLFGVWLATTVEEPKLTGKSEQASGKAKTDAAPPRQKLTNLEGEHWTEIVPGKLLLQNLVDGRKLAIDTGQQDSELLDVRKDGLVLYRVNNEIFSTRIEGDKLPAPKLVVKGEDVPEVHWVFWSKAGTEPHSKVHRSSNH